MESPGILRAQRQESSTPKGKEKMGEETIVEEEVCGICLLAGGMAVRGRIDSCEHYFCFICIMEWAKVESRCPLCKRRFRFIRRPEISDFSTSESVLEIPVRDQVYHPLGNESSALFNPYSQASCKVCLGSNDDELLLLCDLCDSAFHTYCTGLGYTVPEDDWFCHDCTILREEHTKIDVEEDADKGQDLVIFALDRQQHVSIFDIVADQRPSPIVPSEQQIFCDRPLSRSSLNIQRTLEGRQLNSSSSSSHGKEGLQKRAGHFQPPCTMQNHIHTIRKNWSALRSGSISFSSTLDCNRDIAKQRTSQRKLNYTLQETKFSALSNTEQLIDSSGSRNFSDLKYSRDIDRAWKMMQKAKIQRLASGSVSASKGTVTPPIYLSTPVNKMAADKRRPVVHQERHKSANLCQKFSDVETLHQYQYGKKLAQLDPSTKEAAENVKASPLQPSPKFIETKCCPLTNAINEHIDSSASKGLKKPNSDVKSQIQSMVKLSLYRLSKGECLGTERFKDIARASTHSILAACALDHSKSCARPFINQACRHPRQLMPQLHGSSPLSGSCRECFRSFVNHVVKSIMLENSTLSSS